MIKNKNYISKSDYYKPNACTSRTTRVKNTFSIRTYRKYYFTVMNTHFDLLHHDTTIFSWKLVKCKIF